MLADNLTSALGHAGYATDCVRDGRAADSALALQRFDLLILDIGLPGMDGFEVLRRVRNGSGSGSGGSSHSGRNAEIPVLILTAPNAVENRVRGLDLGADDYLVKPFELNELEARVRALTRRANVGVSSRIQHGGLTFHAAGRVTSAHGQPLDLSAREVALPEIFLAQVGRVVSKETIIDLLCQWGEEASANAVEVYMHRLRKKLDPAHIKLATLRGLGYCLEKVDLRDAR